MQQNKARVDAAVEAERYARANLLAEQKKYQFGASTSYLVFQQETNLATAEENLLAAKIAYAKSRVNFDQVMSRTLERNGILACRRRDRQGQQSAADTRRRPQQEPADRGFAGGSRPRELRPNRY